MDKNFLQAVFGENAFFDASSISKPFIVFQRRQDQKSCIAIIGRMFSFLARAKRGRAGRFSNMIDSDLE